MEPVTYVTGAIAIAVVSAGTTRALTNKNKVSGNTCKERREACLALLLEKIDHLTELVKSQKDGN